MTNVYFFYPTTGTPGGYTEIGAGYQNRLVQAGGTPLTTGGSDTHNHTGSGSTDSVASDGNHYYVSSTPYALVGSHNHPVTLSSVGYVDHTPAYKNFRVIYRSITGWDGSIPANAAVFKADVPAGWQRFDSSSAYFIRIASSNGGTGGNDTPTGHSVSGTVDNLAQSNVYNGSGAGVYATTVHNHGSYSDTSDGHTPDWLYWSAGLIQALADTYIKTGSCCLFDGDPGVKWQIVSSQTGRYLKHNGSSPSIATGGTNTTYTHTHNKNITSQGQSAGALMNTTPATYAFRTAHTHTITISLNSNGVSPSYVNLTLYQALVDFPGRMSINVNIT